MRRSTKLPVLLSTAIALVAALLVAVPSAQAATVTITSDYASDRGTFDKSKYLNGNEGGYLPHKSLNWLPESYGQFKEAGLRFVLITHLLNENFYNLVSGTGPDFSYDFSKLDRVILPLVEQGMTPVMGVHFAPFVLGGGDREVGSTPAVPNNNEFWSIIMRHLVQHYKDLGYTGWYWDVWNEPSLPGFWAGTVQQYNEMYRATAEGVKAADPTAKIGGPVTHTPHEQFMIDFFKFIHDNPSVPLDYVSFHEYGGPFDLSTATKAMNDNGLGGKPIFISEWNSTADLLGGEGTRPDTNAGAAYAARQINRAVGQPALDKIFFFAPKEGFTPTKLFSGDLGLVTVDGHRKAVFNTFKLFDKMQPTIMSTTTAGAGAGADGPVGAIATKDPATGKVTLMAWNDQATGTDLSLRLDNLPYAGRNVKVTQYRIDSTYGNYYSDYAAGVRGWDVGPNENLRPAEDRIVPGSSTFERSVDVGASTVVAYVLEPTSQPATDVAQTGPTPIPVGSRNLAFGGAVTAKTSIEGGPWRKAALVDGLNHAFTKVNVQPDSGGYTSEGHVTSSGTEWVTVDLGSAITLNKVVMWPRDDKDCEGYGFPIDFKLQGSNAQRGPWTNLASRTNYNHGRPLSKPSGPQTFQVSGTYRYVRVLATKLQLGCPDIPDTLKYLQLAELQVYSEANLALGATVRSSSSLEGAGWAARYAVDGVPNATPDRLGWASQWGRSDNHWEWIDIDLHRTTTVSRVDLLPRNDAGSEGRGFPKDLAVQVAVDGACQNWTTVVTRADYPAPGSFRQTFGFGARDARCVRVLGTDLYRYAEVGYYLFQLAEIEVYN